MPEVETRDIMFDAKELCDRLSAMGGGGESDRLLAGLFEQAKDGFLAVVKAYDGGRASKQELYDACNRLNANVMVGDSIIDPFAEKYAGRETHSL